MSDDATVSKRVDSSEDGAIYRTELNLSESQSTPQQDSDEIIVKKRDPRLFEWFPIEKARQIWENTTKYARGPTSQVKVSYDFRPIFNCQHNSYGIYA